MVRSPPFQGGGTGSNPVGTTLKCLLRRGVFYLPSACAIFAVAVLSYQAPPVLRYLFVDFNAFFASVEQYLRPELRGKPVGVVAVMTERTSLITASYEARCYGLKTGTPVRQALQQCPELVLVEARPAEYVRMHEFLLKVIESCIPIEQVCSIDEVLCTLSGSQHTPERAIELAHRIKATLRHHVGSWITCSIGIAPNPYLAKTASDLEKPDGLVVLTEDDVPGRLLHLELRDLCGIGPRMEHRLLRAGITTIAQLYAASKAQLHAIWGSIEGERFYENLRGHCPSRPRTKRRSVGHSNVLPPEFRSHEKAFAVAHRLLQKLTARLRRYGVMAAEFHVGMELLPTLQWKENVRITPTHDPFLLGMLLRRIWQKCPRQGTPIHVWVQCTELVPAHGQLELPFDGERIRRQQLLAAIDRINERHGAGTLYIATAHAVRKAAPMRIPFNRIPSPELEDDSQ